MRRTVLGLLGLSVMACLILSCRAAAEEQQYLRVIGRKVVNLYTGPGIGFPEAGTAKEGELLPNCGKHYHWYIVCLPEGRKGYVSDRLVTPVPGKAGAPTTPPSSAPMPKPAPLPPADEERAALIELSAEAARKPEPIPPPIEVEPLLLVIEEKPEPAPEPAKAEEPGAAPAPAVEPAAPAPDALEAARRETERIAAEADRAIDEAAGREPELTAPEPEPPAAPTPTVEAMEKAEAPAPTSPEPPSPAPAPAEEAFVEAAPSAVETVEAAVAEPVPVPAPEPVRPEPVPGPAPGAEPEPAVEAVVERPAAVPPAPPVAPEPPAAPVPPPVLDRELEAAPADYQDLAGRPLLGMLPEELGLVARFDPQTIRRVNAVKMLGDLGDAAERYLVEAARRTPVDTAVPAVNALAGIGGTEGAKTLGALLLDTGAPLAVRIAAARGLARIGDPNLLTVLHLVAESPIPADLRAAVHDSIRALSQVP